MSGAEKAAACAVRKRPYVSCIKVNGVPVLPPLMDKSTKLMAMEAKNRALQLETMLGWTELYQKENYTEVLSLKMREKSVSVSMQDSVVSRSSKEQCGKVPRTFPQCTCAGKEQLRKFASTSCLTERSLYSKTSSVTQRMQVDSCSVSRSSIVALSQSGGSMRALRNCYSAESLPLRDLYENTSARKCACYRRAEDSTGTPNQTIVAGTQLPIEQRKSMNSKIISSPKASERNISRITYIKGGGLTSTESELSFPSPQKCNLTRESDDSVFESSWASGFYRQLFPLENDEDRNFYSESSDTSSDRQLVKTGTVSSAAVGMAEPGKGSRTTSLDYVSARESSVALLEVPPCLSADNQNGSCRLVRQGSYILDKPSEALLDHLKKQSNSFGEKGIYLSVQPTKESSVQTETEVFELFDVGDSGVDLDMRAKVSELRESLQKRFNAAMEMLLVKHRQEQEELTKTFLLAQQSMLLQMKASAVINAAARGFLVRRLMKTKHVQDLIETMEESLKCIFELKGEALRPLRADQELYDRLLQQLTAACNTFYETFFDISTTERMKIIAADRERQKYLQLKAVSLGFHSIRPATR